MLLRDTLSPSQPKILPGPFSKTKEERGIRKQQICNTRKEPEVEATASKPCDSCLRRKGSAVIHSPL